MPPEAAPLPVVGGTGGAPAPAAPQGQTIEQFRAKRSEVASGELADRPVAPRAKAAKPAVVPAPVVDPLAGDADPGAEVDAVDDALNGDAVDDLIHGMKAEDLLAAIREGTLPDEVLEHLRIKAKYDGAEELMPLSELRGERLRLNDYSRKMAEYKQRETALNETQDQFLAMTEAWAKHEDPRQVKQSRRDIEKLIGSKAFRAICEDLAIEVAQERALQEQIPEQLRPYIFDRLERSRELETKIEELTSRASNDAQTVQQQQRKEWIAGNKATMDKHLPTAFKRENIQDGPLARNVFGICLRGLWDTSQPLTQAIIDQTATATRQELAKLARDPAQAGNPAAGNPPAPTSPHLPARRAASGGKVAGTGNGRVQTIDAFRAKLRGMGHPGY